MKDIRYRSYVRGSSIQNHRWCIFVYFTRMRMYFDLSLIFFLLIKELRRMQAKGPFILCGYSFGACIAFDMALQLEKDGDSVSLIQLEGSPKYVTSAIYKLKERKHFTAFDHDHIGALTYFVSLFTSVPASQVSLVFLFYFIRYRYFTSHQISFRILSLHVLQK